MPQDRTRHVHPPCRPHGTTLQAACGAVADGPAPTFRAAARLHRDGRVPDDLCPRCLATVDRVAADPLAYGLGPDEVFGPAE